MRTVEGSELIGTSLGEYLLIVVQNCTGQPWKYGDEEVAVEGAVAS